MKYLKSLWCRFFHKGIHFHRIHEIEGGWQTIYGKGHNQWEEDMLKQIMKEAEERTGIDPRDLMDGKGV